MDNKSRILDIAMNLNRVGNWAADGYDIKKKRIILFLEQTTGYIELLDPSLFSTQFKKTFARFLDEFHLLKDEGSSGPKDELLWAEKMMTWGNILMHRSNLIS